jgi:hypothetical protein
VVHEGEHVAGHVAHRIPVTRDVTVTDIAIVRRDGAQPFQMPDDNVPSRTVAHGPGDKDDRSTGAALFVPEGEAVMDVGWHGASMHCCRGKANAAVLLLALRMELHWRADMDYLHPSPSDAPHMQRFRRGRHDRGRNSLS